METFPKATVLTGDLPTDNDARRLARHGFPVRQLVTGGTCHLDARMVEGHWNEVGFHGPGILFVENVGNLACPSSDDLGEAAKIDLLSVTEGEDKPLKHTGIFHRSALMILTKTDPLPHAEFSAELAPENARKIHPEIDRHHCAIGAHRRGLGPMDGVAGRAPTEGAALRGRRDHLTLELNLA